MLDNCRYDKIKIIKKLSCVAWFIKKHAEPDAENANDSECINFLNELKVDLEKHIKNLEKILCK